MVNPRNNECHVEGVPVNCSYPNVDYRAKCNILLAEKYNCIKKKNGQRATNE